MLSAGSKKIPLGALLNASGFIGFFLFLLLYINPAVIYSTNGSDLFNWVRSAQVRGEALQRTEYQGPGAHPIYNLELTRPFFHDVVSRPGGVNFLTVSTVMTASRLPAVGASAIVLLALIIFWAFPLYIRNSGGPPLLITRWLAAIALVVSCCRYDLYWFVFFTAIAGALVLAVAFQRLKGSPVARVAGFFALFLLCYYLFQWAALLFVAFVIIHEACTRSRKMVLFGFSAAIALAAFYLFENRFIPVDNAVSWKEFTASPIPPVALVAYFPVIALAVRLQPPLWMRKRFGAPLIRAGLLVVIMAAAAFASVSLPVLRNTRTIGRSVHFMLTEQWDAVLKEDASPIFRDKAASLLQILFVNITDHALYKTGRLGEAMFAYPHSLGFTESLLLIQSTLTSGFINWIAGLDLYMDLGLVNLAEKVAGESMENMGPYPFLLEKRALVQAAQGNYEAAAVYLHRLSGMPFYHREAENLLGMIGNGTIAQEERVAHLAACKDTSDYLLYHPAYDSLLKGLLSRNPGNRMAWEYLIALYLQTGQLQKIPAEIGRFRDFGYNHLPANWDEALCISLREDPSLNPDNLPVLPQQETMSRYGSFLQSCAAYKDSLPSAAQAALAPSYGSTYFYCYVFGFVPGRVQ